MRAAIVICLCLGVATPASAEIAEADIENFIKFVEAWRPGVYTVATGSRAELREDGVMTGERESGLVVGTSLQPSGCFGAVEFDGTLFSRLNCWQSGSITRAEGPAVQRVRFTPSGTGYATVRVGSTSQLLMTSPDRAGQPPWTPLLDGSLLVLSDVMDVTETREGVTHAIFQVSGMGGRFLWYLEDRQQADITVDASVTPRGPLTVTLIPTEGPDPVAIFGNEDGLFRGQLSPAPTPVSFAPVTVLDGGTPVSIVAVDVDTGNGSVHGEGFGFAVGTGADGGLVVLQAVPADSAADAGTLWRVHPTLNPSVPYVDTALPVDVDCVDSSFCVIALNRPGQGIFGNHLLYENAESPVLDVGTSPVLVNEGATVQRVFTAADTDEDPIRVSMDATVARNLLGVASVAEPGRLSVTFTAPANVCKDEPTQVQVAASDGLGTHDDVETVSLRVVNVRGPDSPSVSPTSASTAASGAPRDFVATGASGVCPTVGYQWTAGGPDHPVLVTDASGRATFTPPDFLCDAAGRTFTYTARGLDEGGQPSDPTSFTVDVAPWGRPSVPFPPGAVRTVASGPDAGVVVVPDSLHPCEANPALPPVETVWSLADGDAGVPAGFIVRDVDGTPVSLETPVVSGQLRVEATGCTRASLSLAARNRMETVAAGVQESADAVVRVDAEPAVEDFSTTTLSLTSSGAPGAGVDVSVGTSLRCPREGLRAELSLLEGGTEVDSKDDVSVPGTWSPALPEACAPAGYVVRGQLFDDSTGTPVAGDVEELAVADTRPVGLGPLQEGAALVARCGEGATGTLTQTVPSDTCRAETFTWASAGGPALAEGTLSGQSVTVATLETGLEGLVGESLTLSVTASTGDGRTAATQHVVPITAEPFVELRHETESPTTSEMGLVGVVARLRNTTECGVQTLRHVEYLEGRELVPGSVRLDGQPVTEQRVEGGFAVDGISLEPNGTRALTYVIRPPLFASPRFNGEVTLNRVVVSSVTARSPGDSGCGCSGGGSGAAVFGLLTLAGLLRRRRDVAAG